MTPQLLQQSYMAEKTDDAAARVTFHKPHYKPCFTINILVLSSKLFSCLKNEKRRREFQTSHGRPFVSIFYFENTMTTKRSWAVFVYIFPILKLWFSVD